MLGAVSGAEALPHLLSAPPSPEAHPRAPPGRAPGHEGPHREGHPRIPPWPPRKTSRRGATGGGNCWYLAQLQISNSFVNTNTCLYTTIYPLNLGFVGF